MKIFISYRHGDAVAADAKLTRDRLGAHFGDSSVFLDSRSLQPGDSFPPELERQLASCSVVLVLIDPHWIETIARLHEPGDWVHRELEIALRRRADDGVRVIPLLLQGARPLDRELLPPTLATLADLHAIPLRGSTLDDDLASLVQRLKGWTPEQLMLWLQARRQATLATVLAVVVLMCASIVALFDLLTLDTRIEALTLVLAEMIEEPQPNEQLVTVVINRETERRLGKSFDRSWRAEHAAVIRSLAEGGAAMVAFDIYLDGTSPHDEALAEAATAASAKGTGVIFGIARAGVAPPLPTPAIEWGLLCMGTELEWARLAALGLRRPAGPPAAGGAPMPTLALAALPPRWEYQAAMGLRAVAPGALIQEIDFEHRQVRGVQQGNGLPLRMPLSRSQRVDSDQACAALQHGDEVAQRLVRFTPLPLLRDPARRLRYEDLCCASTAGGEAALAAPWRGKIVLVGSELESHELREVLSGLGAEQRWGYELHADLINTLLDDVDLRPLSLLPQFLLMLAMGGLGIAVRFWPRLWKPRWRAHAVLVAVPLAYLLFSAWLCAVAHVLLNASYHIGAFLLANWISGRLLRRRGLLHDER